MPKTKPVCSECGSPEVLADAYVYWNDDAQEWEIQNVFDQPNFCESCEGECSLEWIES